VNFQAFHVCACPWFLVFVFLVFVSLSLALVCVCVCVCFVVFKEFFQNGAWGFCIASFTTRNILIFQHCVWVH
jgi:hypothetical protein